jgi:oligosaccharide repeat unit polymerase
VASATWGVQPQFRQPFTVPVERYVLLPALLSGFAVAIVNYTSATRLPSSAYLAFAVLQLAVVTIQVLRRNLLAGTMGMCLTLILLVAALIERAPYKDFNATFTSAVYRHGIVVTSYAVLLASTCLYHAITLWFVPTQPWVWPPADPAERSFGRATTWPFFGVGTLLLALTVPGDFIANVSYGTSAYFRDAGPAAGKGGLSLLASVFITFAIVAASRLYGFHSLRFRFTAIVSLAFMVYFRLLRGSRSGAIGLFATVAFLYYMNSKSRPWKRVAVLLCASFVLLFFFNMLADVRATAHRIGFEQAIDSSMSSSGSLINHPMKVNLLPQMYWHLLHCVDLYQMNVRLDGRTFFDLIPEAIPQDISDFFHIQRPLSAAWRLAGYRIHGGGMFVIAEGYWNFGMPGALCVAVILAIIAAKLEHWFRAQEPILSCSYFGFLGTFGFGIYYGLQSFMRAFESSLVLALALKLLMNLYRRRFEYRLRVALALSKMMDGNAS